MRDLLVDKNIQEIANQLWEARLQRQAIAPLSDRHPGLDLKQAYAISRLNYLRRIQAGEKSLGRKIGLTSLAVQAQLNVHQPDFGYLTDAMICSELQKIDVHQWIQPRVEGEVAFFLGKDVKQGPVNVEKVMDATDFVSVAIEIIDSRIADWKIKVTDTVADNASSAGFVLGEKKLPLSKLDLSMAGMKLSIDGEVQSTGMGQACLGHPIQAVIWLMNTFLSLGEPLRAGDIILSGAYGPVVPIRAGQLCEVEISGLGKVRGQF